MARPKRYPNSPKPKDPNPLTDYEKHLIDAGGNEWTSSDGSKRRIYFNEVKRESDGRFMTVYYDCVSKSWQTGRYADEFVRMLRERIDA